MRKLIGAEKADWLVSPGPLAAMYYHEARLCWLSGSYVATIVMTQLAFEEILRKFFRRTSSGNRLHEGKTEIDDASFSQLIHQASHENWLTKSETKRLTKLRKELRNRYVHTKTTTSGDDQHARPEYIIYDTDAERRIAAPSINGGSIVADALEAIELLESLFPEISTRLAFASGAPKTS